MKKLLLTVASALSCIVALAQIERDPAYDRGYLIVAAGPAIPMGHFANTDRSNDNAGLAKTGFTANLHGAIHLGYNFSVKATGFYSRHQVENVFESQNPGAKVDHWQYYGLTIGPVLRLPLAASLDVDFAAMTGIANVNSYKITNNGELLLDEDWALTVPLKIGAGMRYLAGGEGGGIQLMLGTDYTFMRPKINPELLNDNRRQSVQVIHVVNVFAGVGIGF